ncbi:nitroreductase [Clostridium cellulovorans 743B]|uniref:Nitroreductase n=2 Tax=Clostridium cellulovorans TaxID=1493 RepID=D9SV67_CLOC7|nr:nitroreductase [Clostridium cellulovorans 743B]
MNNLDFYSTILKRKSVRKYSNEPIDSFDLQRIKDFIEKVTPLYDNIKTDIVILPENEIKTILPIKVPHYIVVYSERKDGYLQNVGFMLQQVELFLSSNGIGACWLGMSIPQKVSSARNGLGFVITLAFGNANEPVHRDDISEFKRKALSEISSLKDADKLLEAVRLAPSATNSQPWYFSGSIDNIIISRKLPNIIKAVAYNKFNRIDMGIALCHLKIAALHMGKTIEFNRKNDEVPKGHEYITTAHIK